MKATGIVRKMDPLGRIVLPMELRRTLDIAEKDPLEIYVDGDTIMLKKYVPGCVFCNNVDKLIDFEGQHICKSCIDKLTVTAENKSATFNTTIGCSQHVQPAGNKNGSVTINMAVDSKDVARNVGKTIAQNLRMRGVSV